MKKSILITIIFLFSLTSLYAEECLFCEQGKAVESQEVYASPYWRVLINYRPSVPGHLLLIPKSHIKTRHELSLEEHRDLYDVEEKVHKALIRYFGNDIENIQYEKNGTIFQTVPHFHIHVLPIEPSDGGILNRVQLAWDLFVPKSKLTDEELATQREAFKQAFSN